MGEVIAFRYLQLCPVKEEPRLVLYGLKKDPEDPWE